MADKSSLAPIRVGMRVTCKIDGRGGFVVGSPESGTDRRSLAWIAVEGSTRLEYWPRCWILPRPEPQQLVAMGGKYIPPAGYPLLIK